MNYYKVFCWNQGQPNYWIGKASSKEEAIKKADRHPSQIYDVWLLEDWIDYCEKRKGVYMKQKT